MCVLDVRFRRFCKTRQRLTNRLFLAKPAFADTLCDLQTSAASRLRSTPLMDLQPNRDPESLSNFARKQTEQRTNAQKVLEDTIVEIDVAFHTGRTAVVCFLNLDVLCCRTCWSSFASKSRLVPTLQTPPQRRTGRRWWPVARLRGSSLVLLHGGCGAHIFVATQLQSQQEKKGRRIKSMTEQAQELKERQKALRRAQAEEGMLKDCCVSLQRKCPIPRMCHCSLGFVAAALSRAACRLCRRRAAHHLHLRGVGQVFVGVVVAA